MAAEAVWNASKPPPAPAEQKLIVSKEERTMCDYSLAGIPNRLAVEGEELVVHRFPTGSLGLASLCASRSRWWSAKQTPAVCVPPGARLLLKDIPECLRREIGVGPAEEVTFVQLSAAAYQFRDAVRFSSGKEIRLQRLQCGQHVDVLSLASRDFEREEHQKLRRNTSAFSCDEAVWSAIIPSVLSCQRNQ
jgi:hypothetical protein